MLIDATMINHRDLLQAASAWLFSLHGITVPNMTATKESGVEYNINESLQSRTALLLTAGRNNRQVPTPTVFGNDDRETTFASLIRPRRAGPACAACAAICWSVDELRGSWGGSFDFGPAALSHSDSSCALLDTILIVWKLREKIVIYDNYSI